MVEHSPDDLPSMVPILAGNRRHGPISSLALLLDPDSNPSKHKLLPPPPTPTPLKCGIQFQGDRGLKIKKFIGGSFCRAKQ